MFRYVVNKTDIISKTYPFNIFKYPEGWSFIQSYLKSSNPTFRNVRMELVSTALHYKTNGCYMGQYTH